MADRAAPHRAPAAPSPPVTTVRDLRRGQILAVARQLVAEEGLEALTIGALEARLQFTRGVITYHFHNKDDLALSLLQGAIDDIDRAMRAAVDTAATTEERVLAVLRGQVDGFLRHPEAARVLLSYWSRLASDHRVGRVNAATFARYREQSARLVRALQEAGDFVGEDPDVVAALLVGIVTGLVCQHTFHPGAIDAEAAVAAAARLLARGGRRGGSTRRRRA